MNNKLLLSRSVAKIAIVLVAVVAILVTLTFTAPYRAFADDNYQPNVDLTENAEVPGSDDSTSETSSNVSDGDSEDPAPVDGVVVPGNDDADSASNDSGAETVEIPLGEDRAPSPQQRGESRQARQRGFETWQTNLENGPLVTRIRQQKPQRQDPKEESQVFMRHTITKDTVVSGPLEAKVQFQNGFDVTGLHGAAELRIYDPNGREIRTVQGNPNSDRIPAVDNTGGNGWGGLLFRFDGEIAVSAGSTFEVDMVFHGRGKNNVRRQNPRFQGPLGPGVLSYKSRIKSRFAYPGQVFYSCTQPAPELRNIDVRGFRIVPNANFKGEIKRVFDPKYIRGNNVFVPVSQRLEVGIDGLQADGVFASPVEPKSGVFCVTVEIDADEEIDVANVSEHFGMALDYVMYTAPQSVFEGNIATIPDGWDAPDSNPTLPNQCGLNIALVMDASNSIHPDGVDGMVHAANQVVEKLSGTGSSMGIYNFASSSPRSRVSGRGESLEGISFEHAEVNSKNIDDPEGRRAIDLAIAEYGTQIKNLARDEAGLRTGGSTNWEAALQRIREYNNKEHSKYDAVYFITDGYPTISMSEQPAGGEKTQGGVVHVDDVNRARKIANEIKRQGTYIQPIMVGLAKNHNEVVAKDSTVQGLDLVNDYVRAFNKAPAHLISTWRPYEVNETDPRLLESLKYSIDTNQIDVNRLNNNMVLGHGFGNVLAARRNPQPKPDKSRPFINGETVLDSRDWNSWAAAVKTPQEIGDIIGYNNTVVVEDFEALENELSRLALASCGGSVTLTKELIDANGQPIQDASVAGWEFKAHTPEGSYLLVDQSRVSTTSASTDDDGHVRFQLETDKPDQHVAVDLTETQRPGFELAKLGDAEDSPHAQCSVQHLDSGTSELLPVQNFVNGFNVQAAAGQVITCRVVNRKLPDEMRFKISKLDFETQKPIDGAKFQVFAANAQGEPDWERGPVWDTDNQSTQTMNPGEYYLVETQAPPGYSLMPQPVYFELAQNDRGTYLSAAAPFILNTRIDQEQDAQGRPVYVAVMELANVLKGDLPLTGGRGVWGFALSGLLILALGSIILKRRHAGV